MITRYGCHSLNDNIGTMNKKYRGCFKTFSTILKKIAKSQIFFRKKILLITFNKTEGRKFFGKLCKKVTRRSNEKRKESSWSTKLRIRRKEESPKQNPGKPIFGSTVGLLVCFCTLQEWRPGNWPPYRFWGKVCFMPDGSIFSSLNLNCFGRSGSFLDSYQSWPVGNDWSVFHLHGRLLI